MKKHISKFFTNKLYTFISHLSSDNDVQTIDDSDVLQKILGYVIETSLSLMPKNFQIFIYIIKIL